MTDANYIVFDDLLKEDLTINAYMAALNNMPTVSPTCVPGFHRFCDSLESYICALCHPRWLWWLWMPLDANANEKIRKTFDLLFAVKYRNPLWKVKRIPQREVEVQELSAICPLSKKEGTKDEQSGSASMFVATADEKVVCIFCGKDHTTRRCRVVKSAKKISQILKKKRRCFCFVKGHILKDWIITH